MNGEKSLFPPEDSKGAALITAIIVLTFLAVLGASQTCMVLSRLNNVTLEADRLKSYYLAEAGYTQCQHEMGTGFDSDEDGIGTIPWVRLGEGLYTVQHDYGKKTITATGIVNDVKRTIFVKYDSM